MFAFMVARRYLASNPAQTALLLAGVALGVVVFVFITALIEGLAVRLTDEVTSNSAHVSLEPDIQRGRILATPGVRSEGPALVSTFQRQQIRQWRAVVDQIRAQGGVAGISQNSASASLLRASTLESVAAPLPPALKARALQEVDQSLIKEGVIDKQGKVSNEVVAELSFERVSSLPTPGMLVKGCLDSCDVCEPALEKEIQLDLERKQLQNELLKKQIALLEKSQEYRCCPVGEEEPATP